MMDTTLSDDQPFPSAGRPDSGSPVRVQYVGLIAMPFAVAIGVWGVFLGNHLGYTTTTVAHMPSSFLLPFFLLIFGPTLLLRRYAPYLALRPAELLIIFWMGLIAATVPDRAMTRYLLAIITTPHYFANPENQWAEMFFDYLPQWMVLSEVRGGARGFFEGIPAGQPIPWLDWFIPLFWWMTFLGAILFTGTCLIVILRKQWIEHERLQFPLGQVAVRLIGVDADTLDSRDQSVWPACYRTRMFKIGCAATFLMMAWNCGAAWDLWAPIPITGQPEMSLVLGQAFPPITIRLYAFITAFAYFIHVDILFSVWVFQLVRVLEAGLLNRIGVVSTSGSIVPGGLVSIQFIGGMISFVLIGLWMSRRHLLEVWYTALGRQTSLQDRDELFSYRTAVIGLIVGFVYLMCWLNSAGLSIPITMLLLIFLFVFYLALARILAEAGFVDLDLPINAHEFTVGIVGSANLRPADLTVLGLANAFARNWRTFTMVGISHVAWFQDYVGRVMERRETRHFQKTEHNDSRRRQASNMLLWIAVAFGLGVLGAIVYTISAGYASGAQNLRASPSLQAGFYQLIVNWMNNATQISQLEIGFLMLGALINSLIMLSRYLVIWMPLHPIGFVVAASGDIAYSVFSIFTAWLIKVLILRIGSVQLYHRVQPLFLGILVGYVLGVGLYYAVNTIWFADNPFGTWLL
ncbi:MAG: DUF6785 family protein [Gemmatimonadota bacterium]|nr:DUF6785 family protein [Gemmatimonadota bacterium]